MRQEKDDDAFPQNGAVERIAFMNCFSKGDDKFTLNGKWNLFFFSLSLSLFSLDVSKSWQLSTCSRRVIGRVELVVRQEEKKQCWARPRVCVDVKSELLFDKLDLYVSSGKQVGIDSARDKEYLDGPHGRRFQLCISSHRNKEITEWKECGSLSFDKPIQ